MNVSNSIRLPALAVAGCGLASCVVKDIDGLDDSRLPLIEKRGAEACAVMPGLTLRQDPTEDLGQGIVSTYVGADSAFNWVVTDCAAGKAADITIRASDFVGFPNSFQTLVSRRKTHNRIKAELYDQERLTFDWILEKAGAENLQVKIRPLTEETCGCATFYPELRQSLAPFEDDMGIYQ